MALELERPFILCVHDLVYLHFRELYVRKHPELVGEMERVVYAMANKAAKVVFNSHYIQRNEGLRFLGLLPSKTRVIRLAAPAEEYRTFGIVDETAFRNKYRLFDGYIVYPSVIRAHKNHDRLIEAFHPVPANARRARLQPEARIDGPLQRKTIGRGD